MTEQLAFTLRDKAIDQVEASNRANVERAVRYVSFAAPRLGEFTTDDLFEPDQWQFTDPRALGAVMKKAARAGHITATDRYRPSTHPACHGRPKRIWISSTP